MKLTDSALLQFKKLMDESENPKSGIRFFTVQGCCSPSLQMDIAENPGAGDLIVTMGEVDFFITPEADKMLSEITLDYNQDGFRTVKVKNEVKTGGCC